MNRTQETRKTGLQPQRPERLALAIARPTFDLAYARERWRAAQRLLDAEGFALYPESILEATQLDSPSPSLALPRLPSLTKVRAGRGR